MTPKRSPPSIAGWTGIPVGKMLADEIKTVLNLKAKLEERVIGRAQALEAVGQRIRTARANLTDPGGRSACSARRAQRRGKDRDRDLPGRLALRR